MLLKVKKGNVIDSLFGLYLERNRSIPLLLNIRLGIHSIAFKKKFVLLVLDNENIIVTKKIISPNRFFFWNPKFGKVIESMDLSLYTKFEIGEKLLYKIIN